jgi:hypothetical protein
MYSDCWAETGTRNLHLCRSSPGQYLLKQPLQRFQVGLAKVRNGAEIRLVARRWIFRDEHTPTQYPYTNNLVIIRGW